MPTLPKGKQRPWIPVRPSHMRDVDNSSFYNSRRWRSISKTFRKRNPLCVQCKRDGTITPSQCVDNIKPISQYGMGVATDIKNLQSLCTKCHNSKSGRESSEMRKTKVYDRNNKK